MFKQRLVKREIRENNEEREEKRPHAMFRFWWMSCRGFPAV